MALADVTNKVGFQSGLRTCYHGNKALSLTEETSLQHQLSTPATNSRNLEGSYCDMLNVSGESKVVSL